MTLSFMIAENPEQLNGKRISEIVFPGNGNALEESVRANAEISLVWSYEYHGTYADNWVLKKKDGHEIARYNVRQLTAVIWAD